MDGEIPPGLRGEIEHHLGECRTCRILYDSMKKTLLVVTEAGSFELSEPLSGLLRGRIMAGVRAASRPAGSGDGS